MKSVYKYLILIFSVIVFSVSLSSTVFADDKSVNLTEVYKNHSGETMIVSHKGDWKNNPENSISAIKSAVEKGADIVEIDVKMLVDGTLILMDYDTVTTTTYGYGENTVVSEMTYNEIKELHLLANQGGYAAEKTNETVPTVEQLFGCEFDCLYLIDASWDIRESVYNLALRNNMVDNIIFYIDDAKYDEIEDWKSTLPVEPMIMSYFKGNVIFVATSKVKNAVEFADGIHLATKNPYGVVFGKTVQNKVVESGIRAMAAPCIPELCGQIMQDSREWWDYLIGCGFNMIMTDNVAELHGYLESCNDELEVLKKAEKMYITDWKLPDFKSDNFYDYKLAYINAVSKTQELLNDESPAYSDIEEAVYELEKAHNDIMENYDELKNGTAGMTITPVRVMLAVLAVAAVTVAEIYIYKKKKK